MNYISDIVLNFFELEKTVDFFEWNSNDNIIVIGKIPLFRVSSTVMNDLLKSRVSVSNEFLESILNKTYTDNSFIKYSALFTDLVSVIALKFNEDGLVLEKSNLLIDEEDIVIEEGEFLSCTDFNYKVVEEIYDNSFLTRREKFIRKYLLNEINNLYEDGMFDEINYLYSELYSDNKGIDARYKFLIDDISNNYDSKYNKLFDVIEMIKIK